MLTATNQDVIFLIIRQSIKNSILIKIMLENKLNFAHLCDDAIISQEDGKISIIGLFKEIISSRVGVVHPKMALVSEIFFTEKKGYNLKIEFEDPSGNEFNKTFIKSIEVPDPNVNIGQILKIKNIELKKQGTYRIKLYIDGDYIGEASFDFKIKQ